MPATSQVQRALEEYRAAVRAQEAGQMRDMAQRWLTVERSLEAAMQALAQQAAELQANGQRLSRNQLYEMERYRGLIGQAYAETSKYQRWAQDLIEQRKVEMAQMGAESSREMIRASYLDAGTVVSTFDVLPAEAVEAMAALTSPGAPLQRLLQDAYSESVQRLTDTLLASTAKGINPRKTARMMADAMAGNLDRALRIARTEQLRAFRSAATEQMKASGVVTGWIWRSAMQSTTCLSCLAMDGTVHDLDEELNDHPEGRCFRQPIVEGLEPLQATSGADWFATLDPEQQETMMGTAKYEAWKEGRFDFSNLARVTVSEEWGAEVRVATHEELGL
jgi:hypothetical protein